MVRHTSLFAYVIIPYTDRIIYYMMISKYRDTEPPELSEVTI